MFTVKGWLFTNLFQLTAVYIAALLVEFAEDAVQANQQASGFVERLVDKAAWNERSKRAVLKALFCAALL
ncbi:hypothetical protein ACH95_15595 [Bacillus glycinifermentans]|nr:hypothetical protein ACH95_15595 [Bacillus glycinifermentans]